MLSEYTVELLNIDIEDTISRVKNDGLMIIPNYVPKEQLENLNKEFDSIINKANSCGFSVNHLENGIAIAAIRNQLSYSDMPVTLALFGSTFMGEVARGLYNEPTALNHQIYINQNGGTDAPIPKLPFLPHFDTIRTLKFFVYLSDTDKNNGAMFCHPGSVLENRAKRLTGLRENKDYKDVNNVVPGNNMVPIEAPAGAMFIFDTDMSHNAGHVQLGRERRIMRGHTRSVSELKIYSLEREAVGVTV